MGRMGSKKRSPPVNSEALIAPAGATVAAPIYRRTVLSPLFQAARSHSSQYDRIDLAHAVMLVEAEILTQEDGSLMVNALKDLAETLELDGRPDAGTVEDLFFLREDALAVLVGPDLAGRLHTGRSRNDLEATIFRLALRANLLELIDVVIDLAAATLKKARVEADTLILAYTHGQPAQPTTFGHYLAAFGEVVLRDLGRLLAALEDVDRCPMGAAAITGTGFPIDRYRVAALLGFPDIQRNTYGCIASADPLAAAFTAMRIAFLNVGRLAQDLAFWSAFEVGQAVIGDAFVQISSIMPQKRNPLAIEHLRTMASLGAGKCETVVSTLHNTPFADMVDAEGPTQEAGVEAFEMAHRVFPLLAAVIEGVQIDEQRVLQNIDRSCATMTELADSLVRAEGISFRQAHEIAADLSRVLISEKVGINSLTSEAVKAAFTAHIGREPAMSAADLLEFAAPGHSIKARELPGGPGPLALAADLDHQEACIQGIRSALKVRTDRIVQADTDLVNAAKQIAG